MAQHRLKHKILLSQAILGFLLDAEARSLSPHTISDYPNAFRELQAIIGDPPIESISADDIRRPYRANGLRCAAPEDVASG